MIETEGGYGLSNTDETFHRVYSVLEKINWRVFPKNGIDDSKFYRYYYCEDKLYVIKNVLTGSIMFEYARSPIEALCLMMDGLSAY